MTVPTLELHPTRDSVRAYLAWLAASPYAYHIDDNPEDLSPPLPVPVVRALRWNADAMWNTFSADTLWDIYYPAMMARESEGDMYEPHPIIKEN